MAGFQQYGDDWLRALNDAKITRDLIDIELGAVKGLPPVTLRWVLVATLQAGLLLNLTHEVSVQRCVCARQDLHAMHI